MFTNCTSPLVRIETYNTILKKYEKLKNINDSINTVTNEKQFLYLDNKALNFDPKKTPNSQNLPNIVKLDRKSTRLNSSHKPISYAVFCLKKKTHIQTSFRDSHPRISASLASMH